MDSDFYDSEARLSDQFSDSAEALKRALKHLGRLLEEQARLPELELPNVDSDFYDSEARLSDTLGKLTDVMEALNQSMDQGGGSLSANLRQITNQFSAINQLLRSAADDGEDREVLVDISEEALSAATLGKVDACRNLPQYRPGRGRHQRGRRGRGHGHRVLL